MNEKAGWDYINANYWNTIPMSEEDFRNGGWSEVFQIGPNVSGDSYLIGWREAGHVGGYYCLTRQSGCMSPN